MSAQSSRIASRIAARRLAGIEHVDPDPRLLASEALRLARVAETVLSVSRELTKALQARKHAVQARDPRLLEQSNHQLQHAAGIFRQVGMHEYADKLYGDLDFQGILDERAMKR